MAFVFYFKRDMLPRKAGEIYGVHFDNLTAPPVPEFIDSIIVAGPPITWPSASGEQDAEVNTVNRTLVQKSVKSKEVQKDEAKKALLMSPNKSVTVQDLIDLGLI